MQTYLIAAFKAFGLINDEARPTEWVNAFAKPDDRKGMIAELLKTQYSTIVPLGLTNSTSGELAEKFTEAFPSLSGESRVKAIRFFLSAAAYAGLKLSPIWKAPKAPRGNSTARRSTRNGRKATQTSPTLAPTPAHPRTKPQSMEEAKLAYFELLISHAAEGTKLDSDVLDRIELLVGLKDTKAKTVRSRTDDKAASEPVNSSPPSESATGDS